MILLLWDILKGRGVQGSVRNITATAAAYTTPAAAAAGTCDDVAKRIGYLSAQSNTAVP